MSEPRKDLAWMQTVIDGVHFLDRRFRVLEKGDGFLLQLEYDEPDVEHPAAGPVRQGARKWYVSAFSTETEVVETAWAAVQRSQLHTAGEHFTYKGRRVYSPHFDVHARIELVDGHGFDGRKAP